MTILRRGRWILFMLLAGSLTGGGALTYKRWPHLFTRANKQDAVTSFKPDGLSSVPPFSTKEPERYQATRIITSTESNDGQSVAGAPAITTILIARDGNSRREEYAGGANGSLIYLETPQGRFVLLPGKKLYADLNSASDAEALILRSENTSTYAPDFSPDRLLHETPTLARYEKLDPEKINGRAASKYRVTSEGLAADGASAHSVTLIWIDDALGLPVRSETKSTAGGHTTIVTVELNDLKQRVEPLIFALPADYAKVDYRQLYSELLAKEPSKEKAKP